MVSPRTDGFPSFDHAYAALIAAAHIKHQSEDFASFVVSVRSSSDDEDIAHASAEEEKLTRRVKALQSRATKNPNDTRLQRRFQAASENLNDQKSVVETVKQNRSIELSEIAKDIKNRLLEHNYTNAASIPHDAVIILEETNGLRYVAFLGRPKEVERLKEEDPCFKGRTLTRVTLPHVA